MFAIVGPLILPFSLSGGGDFFMMYIFCGWLLSYITIIEKEGLMICTISSPGMYLPFREGSQNFYGICSNIKVEVGGGCSTRFWLNHWVGHDTLASMFPNLFLIATDPFATVSIQTCLFSGRMIWAPQFQRWSFQNLSNDLSNLLNLLQPKKLSTTNRDVR